MSMSFGDHGIHLDTYENWSKIIGPFECNGKLIDPDTTIALEMFDEELRLKIMNGKVVYVTIWYCVVGIFCKCGEFHQLTSAVPFEDQIGKIVQNAEHDGYGLISGPKTKITVEGKSPLIACNFIVDEVDEYHPEYVYELTEENEF